MDINELYLCFINVDCNTKITVIQDSTQEVLFCGRFDEMANRISSLYVIGFSFNKIEQLDDIMQRELKTQDRVEELKVYVRWR